MDKKELLDKFCALHTEAKNSGASEDIEVSLSMFKKVMCVLAELNLRSAKELLECYEGNLKYYNFLTESEAEEIVGKFVNQDGSRGPRWRDADDLLRKVSDMGGNTESEPAYNKWALYVTMNKYASDQDKFITKWVGDDKSKYLEACYELAVAQLNDKDRPCWVRSYYGLAD